MFSLSPLIRDDFTSIFRKKKNHLWLVTVLIGWLLFLLNVFLGMALYTQEFSSGLREKLWMYFYIVDDVDSDDTIYAKVMQLSKSLEDAGMDTVFASKNEAFGFLENRIPNVIENFNRFGINNPLPATLYVMFDNDQQYQVLKETIADYRSVISNVSDLEQAANLRQQENRVVTMISLSRFLVVISFLLVLFLFGAILVLCGYMLHTLYVDFHGKIDIKKLLWASMDQTIRPFLLTTWWVIAWSYVICIGLLLISGVILSLYMSALFDMTVWSIIASYGFLFWVIVLIQLCVMIGWPLLFSHYYVKHLVLSE